MASAAAATNPPSRGANAEAAVLDGVPKILRIHERLKDRLHEKIHRSDGGARDKDGHDRGGSGPAKWDKPLEEADIGLIGRIGKRHGPDYGAGHVRGRTWKRPQR